MQRSAIGEVPFANPYGTVSPSHGFLTSISSTIETDKLRLASRPNRRVHSRRHVHQVLPRLQPGAALHRLPNSHLRPQPRLLLRGARLLSQRRDETLGTQEPEPRVATMGLWQQAGSSCRLRTTERQCPDHSDSRQRHPSQQLRDFRLRSQHRLRPRHHQR